jgi:phosphonate transport system substrate-binding protein
MRKTALLASCLLLGTPALAQERDNQVFFCSAVPTQDLASNVKRFRRFTSYLEEKLGVPVRYVPAASYEDTVAAFGRHEVHLAWFGGLAGVKARKLSPGAEAIAQGAEDEKFKTYFIASTKTGVSRSAAFPEGLKGRSFTFGSRISTSGYVMPEYFIRKNFNGVGSAAIFSRVGFSGDHVSTLRAVQSGEFDAGALDYRIFEIESKAGRADPSKVQVIWETPPYQDYHFTIQGDLDGIFGPGFNEKVRQAILNLDDVSILKQFDRSKFIPAVSSQYLPIEEVYERLSAEGTSAAVASGQK